MDDLEYMFTVEMPALGADIALLLNQVVIGAVYEREHADLIVKAFKSVKTLEADISILNNQKRALEEELKELKLERTAFVRAENALKSIASTIDTYNNE